MVHSGLDMQRSEVLKMLSAIEKADEVMNQLVLDLQECGSSDFRNALYDVSINI